ncbi:hypothetical protein ACHAWF_017467 [Thalassiosira exigua]
MAAKMTSSGWIRRRRGLVPALVAWQFLAAPLRGAEGLGTVQTSPGSPTTRVLLRRLDKFLTRLQNPAEQLENNLYLQGNYAPVLEEHPEKVPVTDIVEGSIPRSLEGVLCRNGPNPTSRLSKLYHWFDGHAHLHNLYFEDGKAYYTNQFVPCQRYLLEEEAGEDVSPTLGEYTGLPGFLKILFHETMMEERVGKDFGWTSAPPNTALLMYQDKLYCLNEANVPFECRLRPSGELEPVGFQFFDGALDYPVSAHPQVDPWNGDLLFHSYTVHSASQKRDGPLKVGRFSAMTGRVENYFGIRSPPREDKVPFAHNLLQTENWMIVYDCNVHFDPKAMFQGGAFFQSSPEHALHFGIMPKDAADESDVIWIDTGRVGGIVHPLNAWEEEDGTIVVWTPLCDDLNLDLDNDGGINQFRMVEFRLDPKSRSVTGYEVIDDTVNVEFSNVPAFGRFNRYGYTAIQDVSTPGEGTFAGFAIWDMKERRLRKKLLFDDHQVGGEPMLIQSDDLDDSVYVGVYLQKLEPAADDDGPYSVTNGVGETYFALYDGETADLVARMKMPHRVPYGFHGRWIGRSELLGHYRHHEPGAESGVHL